MKCKTCGAMNCKTHMGKSGTMKDLAAMAASKFSKKKGK